MSQLHPRINPCLWFDGQRRPRRVYYTEIFRNSRITRTTHHTAAGRDVHHRPAGSVMTVEFELDGQRFMALNGGPEFKFIEAVSLVIHCQTQEEIDYFWERLGKGGGSKSAGVRLGQGQVRPVAGGARHADGSARRPRSPKAGRVLEAMLKMKKIDIAEIQRAANADVSSVGMKYLCLVYLEDAKFTAVPDRECQNCGDGLRQEGAAAGAEPLFPVRTAKTVRVRDGRVAITDGLVRRNQGAARRLLPHRCGIATKRCGLLPRFRWREGSIEVRPVRELQP